MKKFRVFQHVSLDGVIQSPGSKDEDPDNGFLLGGWANIYRDEKVGKYIAETHAEDFDLILGRKTYDIWSGYWPKQSFEFALKFNTATKYVVTHRAESLEWNPTSALSKNFINEIKELKQQSGRDLLCWGSSTLMPALLESQVVDELILIVYPLFIGSGKKVFESGNDLLKLRMKDSIRTDSGILINAYSVNK